MRPHGKTPPKDLRQTIAAIFWRHNNGAKWRAVPTELGPWWRAAQLFIRWAAHGAWDRLLTLAQERAGGLELSLAFLDGTNVRAHAKAAGAPQKGDLLQAEMTVKPGDFAARNADLVALAAAGAPRR